MRIRNRTPLLISAVAIVSLFAIKGLYSLYGPELIINFTNSTPLGVYRLTPLQRLTRGEFVAFIPPERVKKIAAGRPWFRKDYYLIKQVAGLAGDEICIKSGELSIKGKSIAPVFEADRLGAPLPHTEGCYRVPEQAVFVLGPDSEWSFDSRYFGVVRREEIGFGAELAFGNQPMPHAPLKSADS